MFSLNCKGRLVDLGVTKIMAIVNTTPDSFYPESRASGEMELLKKTEGHLREGADFVDLGGQSTRPGSERLSEEDELKRTIPAIESLQKHFPEVLLSIDTYYSRVAEEAVAAGASVVNDVSGGTMDDRMFEVVARLKVPFICMHMGNHFSGKVFPANIFTTLIDYFSNKIKECSEQGLHDVIIDPGFGFGKSVKQNFDLVKHLDCLRILGKPILLGVSRKSSIYKTLGVEPEQALNGSTVLHTIAVMNSVEILRVHDVKEAKQVVTLVHELRNSGGLTGNS